MIAVDTNVLVRLVVDDDAGQTRHARNLMRRDDVRVTPTVLLETEWVLRGAYKLGRSQISGALRGILGLDNVSTEAPMAVSRALDRFDAGFDFADALHPSSAVDADHFVTFDERLVRRAARAGMSNVGLPPA